MNESKICIALNYVLDDAIRVAIDAHRLQVRKYQNNRPYICHPMQVMTQIRSHNNIFINDCSEIELIIGEIVAIMHDVEEDCDLYHFKDFVTFLDWQNKKEEGFNKIKAIILDSLKLMNKNRTKNYQEYISKIKKNKISRMVKYLDMIDNSFNLMKTWEIIEDKDEKVKIANRVEKYRNAIKELGK